MWLDDLHHALALPSPGSRTATTPGSTARWTYRRGAPRVRRGPRIVACAQNHDQVGNRALGDRLPAAKRRVASAVVLFSRFTPLLFQGEEYGETAPF